MTQWKSLTCSTAMLLALSATAQADVTGAEVWNNWKSASEGMGQVLTPGSETQDGDTLTIRDLVISMDAPDMTMSGTIGSIAFRDQGDGTVAITLSPTYEMKVNAAPPSGEKVDATVLITQPDLSIIASGGGGTIAYDIAAPTITVALTNLTVDGTPMEIVAKADISDVVAAYELTEGEMPSITSSLNAAKIAVNVDVKEPGGSGTFVANADFADIAATSEGSLSMMGGMEDMPAMLAAGFATAGDFSHGAATYAMDFKDASSAFQMSGKADSGMFGLSLDADAFSYEFDNKGLAFKMSGSDIPLPEVEASFAELGMSFQMPLSESDEPQDFGASVTLDGLQVSEMIWGLADPSGALPHDPATAILELSGTGTWLVNIMDPAATAALEGQMPGEVYSLDLNQLKLAVAGAMLTGAGGFTFDNTDLTTFNGIPAPTGSIDLTLLGGNGLLDKLVAMGLLPEDQAMGARMMMGMFARPGVGEDSLTSKIEVKGDGSISANGQRLQ